MIRCVGAALRGDGNPPEVPVIRTVLRAYNGVWGVPIKHMSAALCAHKCRACRTKKGMMVLSSGRCAPCSLASSIEDSTSRPSELRKRTLVLVLGQVVLTEPLRFRLGHPMDHSNAAGSPRRFAS